MRESSRDGSILENDEKVQECVVRPDCLGWEPIIGLKAAKASRNNTGRVSSSYHRLLCR